MSTSLKALTFASSRERKNCKGLSILFKRGFFL